MTRLPESSSWEEEIELISRSERVAGGLDGPANRPLKSLANRTRYLKDQADTADESIAEKVSAVKTFAEGATLESPREEILFDSYRLVWTGEFPKTVPVASTPETTGGVGAGRWAYTSDAAIRSNLASGEEGMGAHLLAVKQPFSDANKRTQYAYNTERFSFFDMPGAGFDLFNPFTDYDDKSRAAAVASRSVYYGVDQLVAPRMGFKTWKYIDGAYDRSCVVSIRNTMTPDDMSEPSTQSFGISSAAALAKYANRDAVGIYCHIVAPPELLKSVNTTFTATTVTCSDLTPEVVAKLRYHQIIDVNGSDGVWYSSLIVGVDAETKTIKIDTGWYIVSGTGTGIPAAGATMRITAITKAWAANFILSVNEDSRATSMAGFELGMYNRKAAIAGVGYGYDMYSGGDYNILNGFQARGKYYCGFRSYAESTFGFASTGGSAYNFYASGGTRGAYLWGNVFGLIIKDSSSYAFQYQDAENNFITGMDASGRWQRMKWSFTTTDMGAVASSYSCITAASPTADSSTITMPPQSHGKVFFVRNFSADVALTLIGSFEKGAGTFQVPALNTMGFFSDGTYWYPMTRYLPV
ncbi:hypothetical protein AAH248_001565 [Klebsiella michiganensis]